MTKKELYDLPTNWTWTTIDDIGIVVSGGTPSTKEPEFWGEEIAWVTPADLSNYSDVFINKGKRGLTKIGLEYSSAILLPQNSILFSSRAPIGYVAIAKNDLATNQGFKNIILSKYINSKYVYFYLKTIKELAEEMASGTTFLELSGTKFKSIKFPLAPFEEQCRIVNKIEEIFSGIEKSLIEFENTLRTISLQRKNIINRGVKGTLTKDWRGMQNNLKDSIESNLLEFDKKNHGIPSDWLFVELGKLSPKITDGTHHTPKYIEEGINFISVKDIKDGRINFDNTKFISEKEHELLFKRCNPEFGDVLITKSGTIGRLAIVPKEPRFSLFVSVALIKVKPEILNSKYLVYCLENFINSINIADDIKGAVQKNFHLEDIRSTRIPYCSLLEQEKIVEEIDFHLQNLQNLEKEILKAKRDTNLLYQKTLREAFSANLSSQYANDTLVVESLNNIAIEKTKHLDRQSVNKSRRRTKRAEIDLLSIINNEFSNRVFSYQQLFEYSNMNRDKLQAEFNKLEENNSITSSFDENSGTLKYKLT